MRVHATTTTTTTTTTRRCGAGAGALRRVAPAALSVNRRGSTTTTTTVVRATRQAQPDAKDIQELALQNGACVIAPKYSPEVVRERALA